MDGQEAGSSGPGWETPPDPLAALRVECHEVSKVVLALPEEDFTRPTRCPAWNVKELLAHMYGDVDRTNTGLAEAPPEKADADAVSYWRRYDPAVGSADVADRAKRIAAERPTGSAMAADWDAMWRAALDDAAATDRRRVIATWGPSLEFDEFLKTRVLEITVHRMDLELALGRKGWGTDAAVSIVDDILVGSLGKEPPDRLDWDVVDFIDAGTGRRELTERERKILGRAADRFPLLA
ncbi:MAG TPA: maleylpyruvate isomerase N-terminal domain-containing protein [Actinomycetota bacterium]|nr:maleylpyruvate isomerase N-terminal domain-containing protein [Actinomycetota bacterium]